jgi:DNA-binding LacI/PurR family transcriptional regulator
MRDRFGGVPDGFVRQVPNTPTGGEIATAGLLDLDPSPTAIITSTDTLAIGVLHAASTLGRAVPDDLSVVGFDDILFASHTIPALTTLRMPTADIVREGMELAIDAARDPHQPRTPTVKVIAPSLIVRESTARPRAD